MSKTSNTLAKGGIAAFAAGALALASASPAEARHRHHDRIDAGDIIAGALIIGGIAAIASAASKNRGYDGYRYRDRDYRGGYYGHRGPNPRRAIEKCVYATERDARRSGYRFADVTQIRDVKRTRYGWKVKGRLVVDGARGYGYRDRYHRYDDRRYDYGYYERRRHDSGKFTCYINRGRVDYIKYKGIRGLR